MQEEIQNRREIFEQVQAVFAMNGIEIDQETENLLQNFLEGKESYEEIEAKLEKMIAEA